MNNLKQTKNRLGRVAKELKILSDTNRLLIVDILGRGPLTVSGLAQGTHIEQSLLSHHLKVLKKHGWVTATKKGRQVFYQRSAAVDGGDSHLSLNLGCCTFQF